jgi:hypothetical protein
MTQDTTNSLTIRSEIYEGVTDFPHFPIEIVYENCRVQFEDIYIDGPDLAQLPEQLKSLEESRKGEVKLDGGRRCSITLSCNDNGHLQVSFRAEPEPFPGHLILEGMFKIHGEFTAETIGQFIALVTEGETLRINQFREV